ncbi:MULTISPECIES: hypothetical protein [unclassified Nocardia]|uniref:hypothetical protein n=1 Tax=unclassified Nocardia TaxID=2637762 RepID=UPI0024A8EFD0|nr:MULTISPECIES: hypothetical protein [unclassified Nocardia]
MGGGCGCGSTHGDRISFAQRALRYGVAVLPDSGLGPTGGSLYMIRTGFVAGPGELREAVRRLARVWRSYDPPRQAALAPAPLAV